MRRIILPSIREVRVMSLKDAMRWKSILNGFPSNETTNAVKRAVAQRLTELEAKHR